MPAFLNAAGDPVEVFLGLPFADRDGIQRPPNWLKLASEAERVSARIVDIVEPPAPPAGKRHVPGALKVEGGKVVRSYTVEDAPVPVPAPMPDISDRQLGEGMWRDGLIDYAAYLGFVGPGVVPDLFNTVINTLPDDETGKPTARKVARGLVIGAKEYRFDHPFVEPLRLAFEHINAAFTPAHFRERWLAWSQL